jgi:hypothetical protein
MGIMAITIGRAQIQITEQPIESTQKVMKPSPGITA